MCGEPDAALVALTAALELARDLGDRRGEYSAIFGMAEIHRLATRDLDAALAYTTRPWRWPTRAGTSRTGRWRGSARPGFTWLAATRNRAGSWPSRRCRVCRETGDRVR